MIGKAGARRRPRLLILASTYPRWAGDHEPGFVHELAKRLIDRFDVTVLGPHARGASRSELLDGVRVERYRYAPDALEVLVNDGGIMTNLRRRPWMLMLVPTFLIAQAWSLWRTVRRVEPAVIHAHWLIPQGLLVDVLGSLGVRMPPFLVTSHGADLFSLRSATSRYFMRRVVERASVVSVVSNAMRSEVRSLAPHVPVAVEPMGVDMSRRFTPPEDRARSTGEILFVGRLVEKKGVRDLVSALPDVLASHPHATLTIAGFGPEERALREQVRALGLVGHVDFLGAVPQDELPSLYRRAAVFAAPFVQATSGDQEGLGLVAVEAAACGCPLIVSDLPAVRDVIEVVPGARVVNPGDPKELAREICAVLDSAKDGITETDVDALARLRARFDWGCVAERYGLLLTAALERPSEESQACE